MALPIPTDLKRECPNCSKVQIFKSTFGYVSAINNNRFCRSCSKMGAKNPQFGIIHSLLTRKKISEVHMGKHKSYSHKKNLSKSLIGRFVGVENSFYGKSHSDETKQKISNAQKGEKSYKYKRVVSDDTRRKMRISALKKLEECGVAPCIDRGSPEFFSWINKLGFNFIPKRFLDIGYYADGYDEKAHIWVEFDTPHHNQLYKKNADLIRQDNIIRHFENIGNPLRGFLRVNADKLGNVLGSTCVYKGKL